MSAEQIAGSVRRELQRARGEVRVCSGLVVAVVWGGAGLVRLRPDWLPSMATAPRWLLPAVAMCATAAAVSAFRLVDWGRQVLAGAGMLLGVGIVGLVGLGPYCFVDAPYRHAGVGIQAIVATAIGLALLAIGWILNAPALVVACRHASRRALTEDGVADILRDAASDREERVRDYARAALACVEASPPSPESG